MIQPDQARWCEWWWAPTSWLAVCCCSGDKLAYSGLNAARRRASLSARTFANCSRSSRRWTASKLVRFCLVERFGILAHCRGDLLPLGLLRRCDLELGFQERNAPLDELSGHHSPHRVMTCVAW